LDKPTSALKAKPEKAEMELNWAFQPSRPKSAILPRMPSAALAAASRARLSIKAWLGTCSSRPSPNSGRPMRVAMFLAANSLLKSGWASLQSAGASARPAMLKRGRPVPSRLPSAFFTNRAMREGPVTLMKGGTALVAPRLAAKATCGLRAPLVPPTAGWLWQPTQLSRFIAGPSPALTVNSRWKAALPSSKATNWSWFSPASGSPAPGTPTRGPGSLTAPAAAGGWVMGSVAPLGGLAGAGVAAGGEAAAAVSLSDELQAESEANRQRGHSRFFKATPLRGNIDHQAIRGRRWAGRIGDPLLGWPMACRCRDDWPCRSVDPCALCMGRDAR
jgi:hypothetical protein